MTYEFTENGLWHCREDNRVKIGIAKLMLEQLFPTNSDDPGTTIFDHLIYLESLELPNIGDTFLEGDEFGILEAEKATASLPCPLAGRVTQTNDSMCDDLTKLYADPGPDNWLIEIEVRNY